MTTLQQARDALDLTVYDLAERSGLSLATIYRLERGDHRPRPYVARRVAAALGLPPEDITELRPVAPALRLPQPSIRAA